MRRVIASGLGLVLGAGKPYLRGVGRTVELELAEAKPYPNGAVSLPIAFEPRERPTGKRPGPGRRWGLVSGKVWRSATPSRARDRPASRRCRRPG
jgi:hypothetical protein